MKNFTPNILLIDSDPRTLGAIKNALTVVTERTEVLSPTSSLEEMLQNFRPEIVFINFNLDQRRQNLETKEALLRLKPELEVFAYADGADPILIAHTLELGFRDIFVRPFDPDVICTKINRIGSSKATKGHELSYTSLRPPRPAVVSIPLQLIAIDEGGFSFRSKCFIAKGTVFPFTGKFCQNIFNQNEIELVVSSSERGNGTNEFTYYAEPRQPTKDHQSALRHFLLSKQ